MILLAQRLGTRSERWALHPDGSSPSGAVSPSRIWSLAVAGRAQARDRRCGQRAVQVGGALHGLRADDLVLRRQPRAQVGLVPDRPHLDGRVARAEGAHERAEEPRIGLADAAGVDRAAAARRPCRDRPGRRQEHLHPARLRAGHEPRRAARRRRAGTPSGFLPSKPFGTLLGRGRRREARPRSRWRGSRRRRAPWPRPARRPAPAVRNQASASRPRSARAGRGRRGRVRWAGRRRRPRPLPRRAGRGVGTSQSSRTFQRRGRTGVSA